MAWRLLSSSCISLRSFRSSAPRGSSSSSAAGRLTRARARATRCCWPPESCAGRRSASPPCARRAHGLGDALADLGAGDVLDLQPEGDVLGHGHVREQAVGLEDHVDVALCRRDVADVLPLEDDAPGRRAPRSRRSCAASSSCRSRSGPSIEKNSPPGMSSVTSSTALRSPNSW